MTYTERRFYIVQRGDTLWSIATRHLGSPFRWMEIWGHNRSILKAQGSRDEHHLLPGQAIILSALEERP